MSSTAFSPSSETPVATPDLGAIISRVQSSFIRGVPTREFLEPLLTGLLACTRSSFGYIARVLHDPGDGHRFLRMVVLSDAGWVIEGPEGAAARASG